MKTMNVLPVEDAQCYRTRFAAANTQASKIFRNCRMSAWEADGGVL